MRAHASAAPAAESPAAAPAHFSSAALSREGTGLACRRMSASRKDPPHLCESHATRSRASAPDALTREEERGSSPSPPPRQRVSTSRYATMPCTSASGISRSEETARASRPPSVEPPKAPLAVAARYGASPVTVSSSTSPNANLRLYPATAPRKWSHAAAAPSGGARSRSQTSRAPASPEAASAASTSSAAASDSTPCSHSQMASRNTRRGGWFERVSDESPRFGRSARFSETSRRADSGLWRYASASARHNATSGASRTESSSSRIARRRSPSEKCTSLSSFPTGPS
mmetsp:Transcript_8382/g.35046  ORF Transcript_8382/g.35046 Transcript_8382/m.35046 type:complete len:288 (+) Transcript_8382:909-1772(+)